MAGFYRDDLAYVHDAGYGAVARAGAAALLEALRRRGPASGLVIDLGCGSGILSERVAAAGYDVLGIDLSADLLALARKRVPGGRFVRGSLWTAELPPCVAVAAVGEVVNYLFDGAGARQGPRKLFRRVYDALAPGGPFLMDLAGPGRVPGAGRSRLWAEGEDWAVLVSAAEDRRRRLLTREITTFRQVGAAYRRDHEVHRQRLYPPAEAAALLRAAGFRVRVLRGYAELRFARGVAGFLARR
ncbi:MAG TPA: class I SAM-dependent methyltransferase [Gemmataceae bacterium]|nr:class I SAM-dependent methyltransferase [Gemmataceae bacterium]